MGKRVEVTSSDIGLDISSLIDNDGKAGGPILKQKPSIEESDGDSKKPDSKDSKAPDTTSEGESKKPDGKDSKASETTILKARNTKKSRFQNLLVLEPRQTAPGTKGNPRKNKRNGALKVTTTIHFDEAMLAAIHKERADLRVSLSDFVQVACARLLSEIQGKPAGQVRQLEADNDDDQTSDDSSEEKTG